MKKYLKPVLAGAVALSMVFSMMLTGCGGSSSGNAAAENTAAQNTAAANEAAAPAESAAAQSTAAASEAAAPAESAPAESAPAADVNKNVVCAMLGNISTLVTYNRATDADILVQDQIFDRLVYDNADGTFSPRLAKEWKMADANCSIVFTIDENAKWHDGEPVTADDVVFTIQVITNPLTTSQVRSSMDAIVGTDMMGALEEGAELGAKALDSQNVELTFKYPVNEANILTNFNHEFYVLPKHCLEGIDVESLNTCDFWQNPIGSGPFKFESQIIGERVDYVANNDYYLGAPDIQHLTILVTTQANLLPGLMSGEFDINLNGNIPVKDWEMTQMQDNLVTNELPSYALRFMAYNCERPYLTQDVRYALDIAIDREKIVNSIYLGKAVAINTATTPSHPHYSHDFDVIEYDPDKAKQLLDEAGFDYSQTLKLVCTPDDEQTAALVQQDFEKIGVKLSVETMDSASRYRAAMTGECDLAFAANGGNLQLTPSASMISMYRMNLSHIDNPVFDGLISQEIGTLTDEGLDELFAAYQGTIRELVNVSYMVSPNTLVAYNSRLSDVPVADFSFTNWNINNWKVNG